MKPTANSLPEYPRAFISYSWEGLEHNQWVTALAERLRTDGIDILFDRWGLNLGEDKQHFMERAVTDSAFVIVICTPTYAQKANEREGGVGYESMVITAQLAEHLLTNKFIPVLREGPWNSSLPSYLKGRVGANLSGQPYSEAEYETLLRVLHGEPIKPPPIGNKPEFSTTGPKEAGSSKTLRSSEASPGVSAADSLLGPPRNRPSSTASAIYVKPGENVPWETAHVRPWNINGRQEFSLETTRGDEYLGTKDEVIDRFFAFNRRLLREGYLRTNFTPGPDPDFWVLT